MTEMEIGALACLAAVVLFGSASIIAARLEAFTTAWVLLGLTIAAWAAALVINLYACFAS